MEVPALPLDILIHILTFLPPSRQFGDDASVVAITRFAEASQLFCEATRFPTLWKAHYNARYLHSEPQMEASRRQKFSADWRLMYADRRRIDAIARSLLNQMVHHRSSRYEYAQSLWRLGFDVWDVLELEIQQPKPSFFRNGLQDPPSQPYAVTHVYWAQSMLTAISRGYAFNLWSALCGGHEDAVSFPDGFSALSCFFGKPPTEACPTTP